MTPEDYEFRIRAAWQGRISGCMLGKAVELFSMRQGTDALQSYLDDVQARPLRDYIPYDAERAPSIILKGCCQKEMNVSLADDDINYSVLALMLLEAHGTQLQTEDVARAWLKHLPVGSTFTAERAAYKTLLGQGAEWFPEGAPLGFDIKVCADNPFNDWIGAQIRADLYGWVAPGRPELAARLAEADAQLSHQGEGIYGAVVIAVMGSVLASGGTIAEAMVAARRAIPSQSACRQVMDLAESLSADADGGARIRQAHSELNVVHTVNNLGLVIWALLRHSDDFSAAIGEVVTEGLDTDCNGATVGALWGLQGKPLPPHWSAPWQGRVGLSLAGQSELDLEELVQRTLNVASAIAD